MATGPQSEHFMLLHCILAAALGGRRYCRPHFIDGETEARGEVKSLGEDCTAARQRVWDLIRAACLALELTLC